MTKKKNSGEPLRRAEENLTLPVLEGVASGQETTARSECTDCVVDGRYANGHFSSKQEVKRQRRASELPPSNLRRASIDEDSDDEFPTGSGSKKDKADAVQFARQAQAQEKAHDREKARAEAAGRRQERAGRRRIEDEPAEDTPKPSNSAKTSPPASSQPGSPNASLPPEKISHKKGAGKKTKKLGNNQYTKNREAASSPHGRKRNGAGTSSGEDNTTNGETHSLPNGSNGAGKNSPDHIPGPKAKFGKGKHKAVNGNSAKHEDPADMTVAMMKRRMDAMAAYITRAQMEAAGGIGGDRTPSGGASGLVVNDLRLAGGAIRSPAATLDEGSGEEGKKFEEMSAIEMADVVSRSINGWHSKFDHLA